MVGLLELKIRFKAYVSINAEIVVPAPALGWDHFAASIYYGASIGSG
jgi:hypothetical protein